MDHVVYVDHKEKEMDKLLSKKQTMIIRGAAGRKLPHGRVNKGDSVYFINNNGEGIVKAVGKVKSVYNSEKMTEEESKSLVNENMSKLQLSEKQFSRWAGKRYLVLVEVEDVKEIEPFNLDKSKYGNMDDWLLVEDINNAKEK